MCTAQKWKATGEKPRIVKRIVKKMMEMKTGREGMVALIESKVGPITASDGPSSHLRRFYTDNYSALDRFDRLWYEMCFLAHARDWESYFCMSLLHAGVLNARSAWCAAHGTRVPLMEFLGALTATFASSITD